MNKENKKSVIKKAEDKMNLPVISGLKWLGLSVWRQKNMLLTVTLIFLTIVLLLSIITVGFNAVHIDATGESAFSIPEGTSWNFGTAYWWVFVTISTIGYGDVYPIIGWMRVWAIIISLIGIAFIAIYTAIIISGFTNEFKNSPMGQRQFEKRVKREIEIADEIVIKLKKENRELKAKIKKIEK